MKTQPTSFSPGQLVAPAALIVAGSIGVSTQFGVGFRTMVHEEMDGIRKGPCRVDDVMQFVPLAMDLGLGFTGVPVRHSFRDRLLVTATAYATTAVLVNTLKYTVREPRPGSGVRNSFPSGHTAVAFTAAEIVRIEYGPWFGLAAYSVGVATAFMRVYNSRHWITDTFAGAGIGILSAHIAYWMLPMEQRLADNIAQKCRLRRIRRICPDFDPSELCLNASSPKSASNHSVNAAGSWQLLNAASFESFPDASAAGRPCRRNRRPAFLAMPAVDPVTSSASLSFSLVF